MGELIISLLVASIIGHQIDESKIKKYEMVDNNGEIIKVQFSKKSEYSCPMSCNLNHFHYAKKSENNIEHAWSIKSTLSESGEKKSRFSVNGNNIVSYQIINIKQKPQRLPEIPVIGQQLGFIGK
jgi:hypothetical protein